MSAPDGISTVRLESVPQNCRITFEIVPDGPNQEYGVILRSNEEGSRGYRLSLSANNQTVNLHDTRIYSVNGLDKNTKVEIIMKDDIIDVNINNRRCIVNRLPEDKGSVLWFFAKYGNVKVNAVAISPLNK
jgi:hypothetical protein